MPAYNAERTIRDAVESVLAQTFKDYELIIVNDCSQDGTKDKIRQYIQRDDRIILINNTKNKGVAISRNNALKISKGRYITFLDSDDRWLPIKLEKQYQAFCAGNDIVFTAYRQFGNGRKKTIYPPSTGNYDSLLKGNYIGNLTGAYDREALGIELQKNIGHEDYLMWLKLMRKSKKNIGLQTVLAEYRVSANSLSSSITRGAQWTWKIYREELDMSFLNACHAFAWYLIGALKKRV